MTQNNITKDKFQIKTAQDAFKKKGGLMILPTGLGKTRIALEWLDLIFKSGNLTQVLIIVSTIELRDVDWPKQIKIWKKEHLLPFIKIICYDSILKENPHNYSAVIYEEIHNVTNFGLEFYKETPNYKLGMTATEPKKLSKNHIIHNIIGLDIISYVSVSEAVKNQWISPFQIIKIEIELNKTLSIIPAGTKTKPFLTTEMANYNYLSKRITEVGSDIYNKNTNLYKFLIGKRLQLMNNLPSKINAARKILGKIPEEERVIIFSKSISSAEQICPYVYHSKSGKEGKKTLEEFRSSKINRLSVVNSLNEGADIENVDRLIVAQLHSSDLVFTQIVGRMIRWRENFVGKVYCPIAKNTIDEYWFNNAINGQPYITRQMTL